jgi:hypothetical protein
MIYNWSIIDSAFAKELFTDYIKGSDLFKDKVIEIQNILTIFSQDQNRYFLDRYTDKSKYKDYDSGQQFLEKAGLSSVNKEYPIANFITLSEVRKTTPPPLFGSDLFEKISDSTKGVFNKRELKFFLEKMEEASSCLTKQDPQCQFLPITDFDVWDKMWRYVFMGEPMKIGVETIPTPGYWFTKDSSGKLIKSIEDHQSTSPRYFRIRSIDLDDFKAEIDRVLNGGEFTLQPEISKDCIIIKN